MEGDYDEEVAVRKESPVNKGSVSGVTVTTDDNSDLSGALK